MAAEQQVNQVVRDSWYRKFLEEAGSQILFLGGFFRNLFKPGFEWSEFIRQCYQIGYKSFQLVGITGLILGLVMTLQSLPTLKSFGAESFVPVVLKEKYRVLNSPVKTMSPSSGFVWVCNVRQLNLPEMCSGLQMHILQK